MTEKTNVPEIRFAGFTDPWEQRKLGDICERHKEMVPTPKDGYVRMGVRSHAKGTFLTMVKPGAEIEEKELSRVKAHCLVVNIVFAWEQAIAITSTEDEKALVSHRFPQFLFHDDMHPDYFRYAILNDSFERHLWLASPSGAGRNKTLNVGTMLEYSFTLPNKKEQEAIASCLTRLDSLITLHQRKHDKLVQLKKSMLDKMFPKPGETEPEIRFAGFTDPWEQRKLGDVATIVGGGTPSTNNDAYWDGDIDWYSPAELGEQVYADRSVRRITQAGYDSCSATLLPAGKTILFTSRAGIGNTAILRRSACTNQGFQSLVVNDDTDVYFVYSMTDRIKKFAEQKASGSTFLEISGKGLAAGEFAFPSKDEQTAIGSMFKQLDHLITLHQRKLELLRNTKKSLLERMFV